MSRLAGSARPALLPRGGEKIELCVACLHSPDVTPAPTHLGLPYPPTLPQPRTSQWVECQRGGGTRRPGARGTWIPASAYAYLPKTTGWAGVHSGGTPSTDGLLPLPFLTLTLCPHVGWERSARPVEIPPQRGCYVHGHHEALGGAGVCQPLGKAPGASRPGFLYLTM